MIRDIMYVPGTEYKTAGGVCSRDVVVFPKSQSHEVAPVDKSVNETESCAQPECVLKLNAACENIFAEDRERKIRINMKRIYFFMINFFSKK
jgi:hypothetical protein